MEPGTEPAQNTMLLPLENSLKLQLTPQLEGLGEPGLLLHAEKNDL